MTFPMVIDKKERKIIGRALRSHQELATDYTIEAFRISGRKYSPFELADLIEDDKSEMDQLLVQPSFEARRNLATMMAYKLTPRKKLAYGEIERAYRANGITGWLAALRDQIGVGDFEFNDRKRTHLGAFAEHFVGEECKYYGRTINGKYLDGLVAQFGVKKPRVSRY